MSNYAVNGRKYSCSFSVLGIEGGQKNTSVFARQSNRALIPSEDQISKLLKIQPLTATSIVAISQIVEKNVANWEFHSIPSTPQFPNDLVPLWFSWFPSFAFTSAQWDVKWALPEQH